MAEWENPLESSKKTYVLSKGFSRVCKILWKFQTKVKKDI